MENQVVKTPNREDFIKFINEHLASLNFTKDPEKEHWSRSQEVQTGGQTMIINGQRQDIPGQVKHLEFMVDVFGDGEMMDVPTKRTDPFIEIDFSIKEEDTIHKDWPTFCVFFDDQFLFKDLISKIFRI